MKGQPRVVQPPPYLRVADSARALMKQVTAHADLPSTRKTPYRKWRSKGDGPNPFERVNAVIIELHACGVQPEVLRRIPESFDAQIDALTVGTDAPQLSMDALLRETTLEAAENAATLVLAVDRDNPEALRRFIETAEAELHCQRELVRAARHRLRTLHLNSRTA